MLTVLGQFSSALTKEALDSALRPDGGKMPNQVKRFNLESHWKTVDITKTLGS